ncbi:hypothetical protein ACFFMN_26055 [Planobispora siamensis]|nr:hypothetical protein [Planobispora siamensis]
MRRILLILAIVFPVLALGAPAQAGGWALTLMDPVPTGVRPDTTYTVGFWLLQHGTHPYYGDDLGEVALEFTSEKKTVRFAGTELAEPAHYAAAVSLPAGTWQVKAIQGWFAPHEIGTLTVPGDLKIAPLPADIQRMIEGQESHRADYWGVIRPPGIPPGKYPRASVSPEPAATPAASDTASATPAGGAAQPPGDTADAAGVTGDTTTVAVVEPAQSWWRPPYTVAVVLLAAVALAALTYRARRR